MIFVPIGLLIIGATFASLLAGICLGLCYLKLLRNGSVMPPWTRHIRHGWFCFAAGLSVSLYFNNDVAHVLGGAAMFLALVAWLLALATCKSLVSARP